jgi:hypothetical protein
MQYLKPEHVAADRIQAEKVLEETAPVSTALGILG